MSKRVWIGLVAVSLAVFAIAGPVSADQGRWTKGDAEAMLHSYPPTAQIFERIPIEPGDVGLDIRPFPGIYDQFIYCVDDWHVLALRIAAAVGDPPDPSFGVFATRPEAMRDLQAMAFTFYLDKARITTERSPIQVLAGPLEDPPGIDITQLVAVSEGRILAPGELAVGRHTLRVVVRQTVLDFVLFDQKVAFEVQRADARVCQQG
jgi:hypothetical protein